MNPHIMTMLKCVWSIAAHIPHTHFWRPPWGSKKSIFLASCCIFIFIFSSLSVQSVRFCQNFTRDCLFSRDTSESSHKDSLCTAQEDSPARESPHESCFFARAVYNLARSGNRLRARLSELRALCKTSSRRLSEFRAKLCDNDFIFFLRFCVFSDFCC